MDISITASSSDTDEDPQIEYLSLAIEKLLSIRPIQGISYRLQADLDQSEAEFEKCQVILGTSMLLSL